MPPHCFGHLMHTMFPGFPECWSFRSTGAPLCRACFLRVSHGGCVANDRLMFVTLEQMMEDQDFHRELMFYDAQIDKGNSWWRAAFPRFKDIFVDFYKQTFSHIRRRQQALQVSRSPPCWKKKRKREHSTDRRHEREEEQGQLRLVAKASSGKFDLRGVPLNELAAELELRTRANKSGRHI